MFDIAGAVAELGEVGVAVAVVGAAGLMLVVVSRSFHLIQDALMIRSEARDQWERDQNRA